MAIWQFTVELVPKAWIDESGASVEDFSLDDGYETSIAWENNQPAIDIGSIVSKMFPSAKSWHPEIRCWGDEKETDIQISSTGGRVDSIRARIDARRNFGVVCSKIVDIASSLECIFFAPESKSIINSNVFDLARSLSTSNAVTFADDPRSYLNELGIVHESKE